MANTSQSRSQGRSRSSSPSPRKTGAGRRRAASPKKTRSRPARQGRKSRSLVWGLLRAGLVLAIWLMVVGMGVVAWLAYDLPDVDEVAAMTRRPSITVVAADGSRLAAFGEVYGAVTRLQDLPPALPQAILAIEDRRFYSHLGLDPIGLARATVANLRAGRVVQGGSTLTQQVAKNLFLTHERSFRRKGQELLLALWLEYRFTKDQILTLYLNRVYMGAGTYGVEAAAQRYFGHSARAVTPYQAAILAGLLRAPSRLNPASNPTAADARAAVVLAAMVEARYLTQEQAEAARRGGAQSLAATPGGGTGRHFADWIVEQVDAYIGAVGQDITVRTTLDLRLQRQAEQSLAALLAQHGGERRVHQGAVVVLSPDGAVRAMVGGQSYGASQFNRATQARRQPGSTFKPLVYLAGLEAGLTPESLILDAPITLDGWSPSNFDGQFYGEVSLRESLARSLNTAAVRVSEQAGRVRVGQVARRLGLEVAERPAPSVALGSAETSPLALAGAYAAFANGGHTVIPFGIEDITGRDGAVLYRRHGSGGGRVIAPAPLAALTDMLTHALTHGTGQAARAVGRPAAGKTGTSQGFRDAWFAGYTADRVGVVWLGNDDNTPMNGVTGGTLPATLWAEVMRSAHEGLPVRGLRRGE